MQHVPWTLQHIYPGKLVLQAMLANTVADVAEVEIIASNTLPPNTSDAILSTCITHNRGMLHTCMSVDR